MPDLPAPSAPGRRGLLRATAVGLAAAALSTGSSRTVATAAPAGTSETVAPGSSIQAAIDRGVTTVLLTAGTYPVTAPIVPSRGCTIRGVGQATRIRATAGMPTVIDVGSKGAIDGVMIADLVVDANEQATCGIRLNIVGTTGNLLGEPDAATRLDNLWVFATIRDGIVYEGPDTQATVTTRVRVRRAGGNGFTVLSPDNVFLACEATTSETTGQHGFVVGSANCHFHACKAWFCRGYGWHVRGARNSFIGCESQDTRLHGWYIEYDKNTFTGCLADSAGAPEVGGTINTSDGFHVVTDRYTTLTGCLSFDRRPQDRPAAQRYGFNLPRALGGLAVANTGWNNLSETINLR
ncbi:hypothetical protein [Nakamurella sp.]|uniref:hypothetical protein n=1 Tax=Nakamurella sp. TaxID=1869182 RepID=UPI003B3A0D5B